MSTTYNAVMYDLQGSTKRVYESGAELEMQSGALMDLQSGSSIQLAGKLDVLSGGEIELSSGALLDAQSGSTANFAGTMRLSAIVKTTAAGSITNNGLSVLHTTAAAVFTMAVPKAGCVKDIVVSRTTYVVKVRTSTGATVRVGSTANKSCVLALVAAPTSKIAKNYGVPLTLHAYSTKLWMIKNGSTASWSISSAT